ncbi:hypothetical protein BJX66DRAFT_141169 [Aspergillus keveii]|uniref:PAS domain-containing protein n=1 Tax=Aspergillus keveii TaxID=714993 RepID=A0ABR4FJ78_9EURO
MSPLPAHDGTLIPAPQIGDEIEKYAANLLDKIFTYTPIPTVILDSSIQVVEVSNSYLTIFKFNRRKILGSPFFDLYGILASRLPLMLGRCFHTVYPVDGFPVGRMRTSADHTYFRWV